MMAQGNFQKPGFHLPHTLADWIISTASLLVLLVVTALLLIPRSAPPRSLDLPALPLLNAMLNGASGVLLVAGYIFIRRRQVTRHRYCMLAAFVLSTVFLITYVIYHALAGATRFTGEGWIRPLYFTILTSHVVLAAVIVPLVLTTLHRAWRRSFIHHRQIARWTLPIWLYVSVTGVLIYWLLYTLS